MSIYSEAVAAIRAAAEAEQARLDAASRDARAACLAAVRAALVEGVPEGSPARAVCELAAQTVAVGRESDGYPAVVLPAETRAVILAAHRAGVLPAGRDIAVGTVRLYHDGSGVEAKGGATPAWDADYAAWSAARDYRARQSWATL